MTEIEDLEARVRELELEMKELKNNLLDFIDNARLAKQKESDEFMGQ